MTGVTRREFLATSSAILAAGVFASHQDSDTIRIGLIGCGSRGTGAAEDSLHSSPRVKLVALADMFPERLHACRKILTDVNRRDALAKQVELDNDRCFIGFDAYKKLLACDLDLVLLATPPGFRPIHFAAAVDAGKHVFMEKPIAVDPVGVRRVLEAGAKAKAKKLAVVVGTQRRHQKSYIEVVKRIHDGEIGEIVAGRCTWNQGGIWRKDRKPEWSDMEYQLHNWYYFDWLSGDFILEQHVHNIDVMNWVLRSHPIRAVGVGGRQVRTGPEYGNIYDHFAIDYEYPNGVHVMGMCRQMPGTDGSIGEAVVGTKGKANPASSIEGAYKFPGMSPNPYVQEHTDLIESIRAGNPLNETDQIAESSLTAIMARQAAYTGRVVTWDEIVKSNLDWSPPKYELGPLPVRPAPVPGT